MPWGAEITPEGVRFRIFAPAVECVRLDLQDNEILPMLRDGDGWHELVTDSAQAGSRYRYVMPDGTAVPDPASRFQPEDVAGPSEVIDPEAYAWHDGEWKGRPWHEAVLYELHVGTFTREGTFRAVIPHLEHLAELGVTAIELMTPTEFPGTRNWGYDEVLPFAPDSAYGRPEELKALIDAAHARGLMILLDVVYNHFGPEGNYAGSYFPQISSPLHDTAWGKAFNFDAEGSVEVREFFLHNAVYWIEEFHIDGLRLDASHEMKDTSPKHILMEIAERVRAAAPDRAIHLILEDQDNVSQRLLRGPDGGVTGYTAQWNHDMTHLLSAAFGNVCADRDAQAEETGRLAEMLAEGYVLTPTAAQHADDVKCKVPPGAYIAFLQTHDLIGNRIAGDRIDALVPGEALRAVTAILLLLPQTPMLFMGQEWGATEPFPFFCDYHGDLAEQVRRGRCDFLRKIHNASDDDLRGAPDPQAENTFRSAQMDWTKLEEGEHAARLEWFRNVLRVRHREVTPLLREMHVRSGRRRSSRPGASRWSGSAAAAR